jgi:FkbH-like protein
MLAKTNQFNLTTRRRSAAELEEFAAATGGQAVVVRARDRFSDAGVVGLVLARKQGDSCIIDSLLLSCRVIGRGIESALLAHVGEQALRSGAKRLVGEYIATKKNAPCADFYADHGFTRFVPPEGISTDSVFYELDLTCSVPASPKWITVEGNESYER